MRKTRHVLLVIAVCALSALGAAAERHGYIASNDGKGHWLHVLPERRGYRTDRHVAPGEDGTAPLMLELYCRDGEVPVRAILFFPQDPEVPPAERFQDHPLRNLWRGLIGDEPVFREEVRIRLGRSTFTSSVVRKLTSYNTESDYQAPLPAGETVREIVASTGGSLMVEVKSSHIQSKANYAIVVELV